MKLAILGLVAAGIGLAIGAPGLIGIGAYWVVLGPFMRQHGLRIKELQKSTPDGAKKPTIDSQAFMIGTLLWEALGIPSLVIGLGRIGIDADDANWRWLPVVIGGYAVAIGGLSAVMYLAGGAALAYAESGPQATTPATLWITSVTETGTYVNERPRLEFVFRVEPDASSGVAAYEASKKATVPYRHVGAQGRRRLQCPGRRPGAPDDDGDPLGPASQRGRRTGRRLCAPRGTRATAA